MIFTFLHCRECGETPGSEINCSELFRLNTKRFTIYPWFRKLWRDIVSVMKTKLFLSVVSLIAVAIVCGWCGLDSSITVSIVTPFAAVALSKEMLHTKIQK